MGTFYSENDYRYYLAHHGVKGMKWGVRKQRQPIGTRVKGFFKKKAENYENYRNYLGMKEKASEKYDLERKKESADVEREANEWMAKRMYGEDSAKSRYAKPVGTMRQENYEEASEKAKKYVEKEFTKKYGAERYSQAKKSEMAYAGAKIAAMLLASGAYMYATSKTARR